MKSSPASMTAKDGMMDAADFREQLVMLAGDARYRAFLYVLNGKNRWHGRFVYWQESLLAEMDTTAETPAELFERIEPLLRVCLLHGTELQGDPEGFSGRCRGSCTPFTAAQGKFFPNNDCGPIRTGNPFENVRKGVWYCPECRAAEAAWREGGGMNDVPRSPENQP